MKNFSLALCALFTLIGCNESAPVDSRGGQATLPSSGKSDSPREANWETNGLDEGVIEGQEEEQPSDPDESIYPPSTLRIEIADECVSPCSLGIHYEGPFLITRVAYEGEDGFLGFAYGPTYELTYDFTKGGKESLKAFAFAGDALIAEASQEVVVLLPKDTCDAFESTLDESAPIQIAGTGAPSGAHALNWLPPADAVFYAAFKGYPGMAAIHEGIDYIHGDVSLPFVGVSAASDGEVAYVRTGCPQSSLFNPNADIRECGSGWGNHVIINHGNGIFTRYAHLSPGSLEVAVGQTVLAGDPLGEMGNSGRSEIRHLHFELGFSSVEFNPCQPAQSFASVHDPASVGL